MKLRIKRQSLIFLSLFLSLLLLLPGCGKAPEPPPQLIPPQPTPPQPTPPFAIEVSANLIISKAPKVGETANLTFTWDITGQMKPMTKVWLQFDRYDPALYYPLGRGTHIEWLLEGLSRLGTAHSDYLYLTQAVKEQPVSLVATELVVISGNTTWAGEPLKKGDKVRFDTTVRFPEEGEWLISARWQVEGDRAYSRSEIYLTVNKDSGVIGWPKDYSTNRTHRQPPDSKKPVAIFIKTGQAPLVGRSFPMTISIQSIEDLVQTDVYLSFKRMEEGMKEVRIPLSDVMVKGESSWKGSLKKGVPVEFSIVVKFPTEGDWEIATVVNAGPGTVKQSMYNVFLNIGKEKSRYGWPVSHG